MYPSSTWAKAARRQATPTRNTFPNTQRRTHGTGTVLQQTLPLKPFRKNPQISHTPKPSRPETLAPRPPRRRFPHGSRTPALRRHCRRRSAPPRRRRRRGAGPRRPRRLRRPRLPLAGGPGDPVRHHQVLKLSLHGNSSQHLL